MVATDSHMQEFVSRTPPPVGHVTHKLKYMSWLDVPSSVCQCLVSCSKKIVVLDIVPSRCITSSTCGLYCWGSRGLRVIG